MKKLALFIVLILLASCAPKEIPREETPAEPAEKPEIPEAVEVFTENNSVNELAAKPREEVILIKDHKYQPESLIIPAGTSVTWVNMDARTYQVNERKKQFIGPRLGPGQNFTRTFYDAGTYEIFDSISHYVQGKIVVSGDKVTGMAISNMEKADSIIPALIILLGIVPLYILMKKEKKKKR